MTDGVTTTSHTYNGDGDRISQTVDSVTTTYVIDTATPLTMVLSETTGAETTFTLHGLDHLIGLAKKQDCAIVNTSLDMEQLIELGKRMLRAAALCCVQDSN